jgi:hypothetical protein
MNSWQTDGVPWQQIGPAEPSPKKRVVSKLWPCSSGMLILAEQVSKLALKLPITLATMEHVVPSGKARVASNLE